MLFVQELIDRFQEVVLPKNFYFRVGGSKYRITEITHERVFYVPAGSSGTIPNFLTPYSNNDLAILEFENFRRRLVPTDGYTIRCVFV